MKHCHGNLQYNSFCIVWVHAFSLQNFELRPGHQALMVKKVNHIDNEIFDPGFVAQQDLLSRYEIEGFRVKIFLTDEEDSIIEGKVYVEAASFLSTTISLTYRLVVVKGQNGQYCEAHKTLNTDEMIILAGIPIGIEHWHLEKESSEVQASIQLHVKRALVSDLRIGPDGKILETPEQFEGVNEVFFEVFRRYKKFICRKDKMDLSSSNERDSFFVMVDVWEDIAHSHGINFLKISEPKIISHIENLHREELMGLLTLYPYEWRYRDARFFSRVCGENIAIDTDDLVLVSQNVCLVIGTYGRRGGNKAPTDWKHVLKERLKFHVCWPEYLYILEMLIAREHTINATLYHLLNSTSLNEMDKASKSVIENNSRLFIKLSNTILKLDALKFSRYESHKLMYKMTENRLETQRDYEVLNNAMEHLDNAVKNIDNIEEIRRSKIITMTLGIISVASLFQVVFAGLRVPVVEYFFGEAIATISGIAISIVTIYIIAYGTYKLFIEIRRRKVQSS